jgi:hypothetical protein
MPEIGLALAPDPQARLDFLRLNEAVELSSLRHRARRSPHPDHGPMNGGFPEPPLGMPVRVVGAAHETCGVETRVRIPAPLPAHAVRRVVCEHCARPFECQAYEAPDSGGGGWLPPLPDLSALRPRRPGFLDGPPGRLWRWLSVPIAAAAVIGGLVLIQGGDDAATRTASPAVADEGGSGAEAEYVRQPGWSLALPDGWKRIDGPTGAAFAAESADGDADATLWIEKDADLSFDDFVQRSLEQLTQLTGNADLVEQTTGPTLEKSTAMLEAQAPEELGTSAPYTVTLHATGPYRYYLSTSVAPGGSPDVIEDAKLIHNSFLPVEGEKPTAGGGP